MTPLTIEVRETEERKRRGGNGMKFIRADKLIEKAAKEFEGLYRLYNADIVDYETVLNYVNDNPIIKDLFVKYIIEKIRDELLNFDLNDFVNLKGVFCPFSRKIDEVIDGFVDWLRYKGYL